MLYKEYFWIFLNDLNRMYKSFDLKKKIDDLNWRWMFNIVDRIKINCQESMIIYFIYFGMWDKNFFFCNKQLNISFLSKMKWKNFKFKLKDSNNM